MSWLPSLALVLLPAVAAAQPAAPGPRCDRAGATRALRLPLSRWVADCLSISADERIIAAVPLVDLTASRAGGRRKVGDRNLTVHVARARGDQVLWRDEMTIASGSAPEVQEALARAEDWFLSIEPQALGASTGVRIGALAQWGQADLTVREVALLFEVPVAAGAALKLLWAGPGNHRESRRDVCVLDTVASFRLVDARTLEREIKVVTSTGTGQRVPAAKARAMRKACVPPPPEPPRRYVLGS